MCYLLMRKDVAIKGKKPQRGRKRFCILYFKYFHFVLLHNFIELQNQKFRVFCVTIVLCFDSNLLSNQEFVRSF